MRTSPGQDNFTQSHALDASLKIGEVSKLSGIGIEALRFYERSGILGTPSRTASGHRVYKRDVLERLGFIRKAQTLGFSLDEIRLIIAESRTGECPCEEVREIVRDRLTKLDEDLRVLRVYREELAATVLSWEGKTGEGEICGFIENATLVSDRPAALGLRRTVPVEEESSSRKYSFRSRA